MFLKLVVPLLRVATHTSVTDSLQSYFSNPFLAFLFSKLKFEVLAAAVSLLLSVTQAPWAVSAEGSPSSSAASSAAPKSSANAQASVAAPWQPEEWLDVVEPCVFLLFELTERFQVGALLSRDMYEQSHRLCALKCLCHGSSYCCYSIQES